MSNSSSNLLDTIVGELFLLDSQRQPDAFHMAAWTPPRRAHADRRHETLYLFLDVGIAGTGGLAQAMLERFNRSYWYQSGAVTSVLRKAINAANLHMLEENRLLPVSQRRRGGIVCAVLREKNLYLAQIGPAKALWAHGTQIEQVPPEPRDALPLGVSKGLAIQFAHWYLQNGDIFLLTGHNWSRAWPPEVLTGVLQTEGNSAEAALVMLERHAGSQPASALIIQCVARQAAETSVAVTDQAQTPPTSRVAALGQRISRTARQAIGRETTLSLPPKDKGQSDAFAETGAEYPDQETPAPPPASTSTGPGQLDQIRDSLHQAAETLGDGARTLLTRVLPEPEPAPRRRRRIGRSTPENVSLMAGIAITIPLLVAFVVVTFYLQRSASARKSGLVNQAQEAIAAAQSAEAHQAQGRWETALQAAQEAVRVAPDDDQVVAMRDESLRELDALEGVVRPEIIHLWDYGAGAGRRLAAARLQVYVLDPSQHQVTQYTLDQARAGEGGNQPNLVAYRGERVGDQEIGALQDVVWLETGGARAGDALFILTGDNGLLQYSLSWGLSWVPFDTGLAHVNAHTLRPYNDKLYLLDPEQSQIWRFPSAGNGFGPPEGYFSAAAPDLSTAIDMSIDGAVYALLADGTIHKFVGGQIQPFEPTDLSQPLVRPVDLAIEGDATRGALYVGDAGLQSIVALTKDGQFIHQIKAPLSDPGADEINLFAGIEALTIEQQTRTLYVLASGHLYALTLPPLPQSPDASD